MKSTCMSTAVGEMRIHWVKCCKCNEVKVFEDLPVEESTCMYEYCCGGMRIHWVKCCDCTEVKVYEDLPVQEKYMYGVLLWGNEYTGLNVSKL